jgi:hypothetical protein
MSVLKVDLDVKPPEDWLKLWVWTRERLLMLFNLSVEDVIKKETEKGYHFWFHIKEELSFEQVLRFQFLLGDDPARVYFGLQRMGFVNLRDRFNILFSKKVRRGAGR